jgi:hypothetical protein
VVIDDAMAGRSNDRGRHPGFSSFNVLAGGPGSVAERSAAWIARGLDVVPRDRDSRGWLLALRRANLAGLPHRR